MRDLVNFAAHSAIWACAAMVLTGSAMAASDDPKLYVAMMANPLRFLGWSGVVGAIGGFALRLTKD